MKKLVVKISRNMMLKAVQLVLAMVLLGVGGGIYVLLRKDTLRMFGWIESLGLMDYVSGLRARYGAVQVNSFVLFSLPDCLWLVAYILIVNALVPRTDRLYLFWLCALPVYAIAHELLQLAGIASGVFDIVDLMCYLIPLLISLAIYFLSSTHPRG